MHFKYSQLRQKFDSRLWKPGYIRDIIICQVSEKYYTKVNKLSVSKLWWRNTFEIVHWVKKKNHVTLSSKDTSSHSIEEKKPAAYSRNFQCKHTGFNCKNITFIYSKSTNSNNSIDTFKNEVTSVTCSKARNVALLLLMLLLVEAKEAGNNFLPFQIFFLVYLLFISTFFSSK